MMIRRVLEGYSIQKYGKKTEKKKSGKEKECGGDELKKAERKVECLWRKVQRKQER